MSGTEAVMAAVRCARFNRPGKLVVTFGGAYHGWWDGMQPTAGNERTPKDVLQLKDMNALSLKASATARARPAAASPDGSPSRHDLAVISRASRAHLAPGPMPPMLMHARVT